MYTNTQTHTHTHTHVSKQISERASHTKCRRAAHARCVSLRASERAIYIYIYIERERESVCVCVCVCHISLTFHPDCFASRIKAGASLSARLCVCFANASNSLSVRGSSPRRNGGRGTCIHTHTHIPRHAQTAWRTRFVYKRARHIPEWAYAHNKLQAGPRWAKQANVGQGRSQNTQTHTNTHTLHSPCLG